MKNDTTKSIYGITRTAPKSVSNRRRGREINTTCETFLNLSAITLGVIVAVGIIVATSK